MLSKVSKLKVSNRNNKREVRQLTEREGRAGGQRVELPARVKHTVSHTHIYTATHTHTHTCDRK